MSLNATFAALSDPTRRAILTRLTHGEATVSELAEPFDMSLAAVGKHLKVLEKAGLVDRRREAQTRPCRLNPEPLRQAHDWIEAYRAMWEARHDRLEALLIELQTERDPAGDPPEQG